MIKKEVPTEVLQKVTEHLLGSCDSITQVLNDYGLELEDLTDSDTAFIDNEIFLCDQCGWWCGAEEQDENGFCEDCQQDNE